jgi:hypothetical protein
MADFGADYTSPSGRTRLAATGYRPEMVAVAACCPAICPASSTATTVIRQEEDEKERVLCDNS